MFKRRFPIALATALLNSTAGLAQVVQERQIVRGEGSGAGNAVESKSSPEQRKRGRDLLEIAESGAAGLQGGMRAYAMLQIARAYERSDKTKALELLEDALTATRALQDDRFTRTRLQRQILQAIVPLAPGRADELLEQVEPESRETVLNALLTYYEKDKNYDRALEVIYRLGQEKEIPYAAVERLIESLPADRAGDAQQLFTTALKSYRDNKHEGFIADSGDFGHLVVRASKRMPPAVVSDAIDEMLKQAAGDQRDSIAMASASGAVSFGSYYEYRLFQLLPVLRQIDESRAEKLLKEHQQVQTLLGKYPNGTESLVAPEGQGRADRGRGPGGPMFSVSSGGPGAPPPPGGSRGPNPPPPFEMQRMAKIMQDAQAHPQDALANAATLTDPGVRSEAYGAIARAAGKKNASVTRQALEKQLDTVPKLDSMQQIMALRSAVSTYLLLEQPDDARKVIERGLAAAEKLYKEDSDPDAPNTSLKAYWPSAEAWRSFLRLAGKISPAWALSLLKDIPDEEIKVAVETALASSWLDLPAGQTIIMSSGKNGTRTMMFGEQESP